MLKGDRWWVVGDRGFSAVTYDLTPITCRLVFSLPDVLLNSRREALPVHVATFPALRRRGRWRRNLWRRRDGRRGRAWGRGTRLCHGLETRRLHEIGDGQREVDAAAHELHRLARIDRLGNAEARALEQRARHATP